MDVYITVSSDFKANFFKTISEMTLLSTTPFESYNLNRKYH